MQKIIKYGAIVCAVIVLQVIVVKAAVKISAPVWEYMPDAQSLVTTFYTTENVKVFQFDGVKGDRCYIALAPDRRFNNIEIKTLNPSLSCVR